MRKSLTQNERLRGTAWLWWGIVLCATVTCIVFLERERASVTQTHLSLSDGDLTIYHPKAMADDAPLVLLAHGFAGSQQMMQYIARDLARSGAIAVTFDFYGHGRNPFTLSSDVARIEGTTMQLVSQVQTAMAAARAHVNHRTDVSLVGHSMATDITIRAAREIPDVDGIVAISMYSDAVTAAFPKRLLVLSGEWETRLRSVALNALGQLTDTPSENTTVRKGDVERKAVPIPMTEHVAVLFSPATQKEIRDWLGVTGTTAPWTMGGFFVAALFGIWLLARPVLQLLPMTAPSGSALSSGNVLTYAVCSAGAGLVTATTLPLSFLNVAGLGGIVGFFSVWGAVCLTFLWRGGRRLGEMRIAGVLVYLLVGAAFFALALDRYVASFVPVGWRAVVMFACLPSTILFFVSECILLDRKSWVVGLAVRSMTVGGLALAMIIQPQPLGLWFTLLPVLVLFYLVYGTMGRWLSQRSGPTTAGIAQGAALAWALAASMPLFTG